VKGHPENKDVMLRMMTLKDKKSPSGEIVWRPGNHDVPSWSPDGSKFAFVSYQLVPKGQVIRGRDPCPWKRKPLRSSSLLLYGL